MAQAVEKWVNPELAQLVSNQARELGAECRLLLVVPRLRLQHIAVDFRAND
jgi:hypothetical protein